jgi:pimeloyl-ACP methyl ester carboxylesterase
MRAGNKFAPKWFSCAINAPFEDRYVHVESSRIHYLRWGQPGRPGLLFVHGGFAHAHWWDFIAPFFTANHCVAAIDLSGMGDSQYRQKYSGKTFAKEVMAVCTDAGFAPHPVIIGHSFGGLVALKTGSLYGKKLTGVVLADFPIRPPDVQKEHEARRPLVRPKETYPSRDAALKRFRLIPAQPSEHKFILDHIASHSLAKVNGGWSWKFDDKIFDEFEIGNITRELRQLKCRLAVIYGQHSALFPPEIVVYMKKLLPRNVPIIVIPNAYHHLFLDKPFAFKGTLKALLADWEHAAPKGRKSTRPNAIANSNSRNHRLLNDRALR